MSLKDRKDASRSSNGIKETVKTAQIYVGKKMLGLANGDKTGFSNRNQLNLYQTGHNLHAYQFSYSLQRVVE